jgi:hypothetical protein
MEGAPKIKWKMPRRRIAGSAPVAFIDFQTLALRCFHFSDESSPSGSMVRHWWSCRSRREFHRGRHSAGRHAKNTFPHDPPSFDRPLRGLPAFDVERAC